MGENGKAEERRTRKKGKEMKQKERKCVNLCWQPGSPQKIVSNPFFHSFVHPPSYHFTDLFWYLSSAMFQACCFGCVCVNTFMSACACAYGTCFLVCLYFHDVSCMCVFFVCMYWIVFWYSGGIMFKIRRENCIAFQRVSLTFCLDPNQNQFPA